MDTKKLRQKILDLAIRGKLVPQDPNDEPASVLLERIRAEKERLIKEGKIKRSKKSTSDTPHYENVPFEVPESWKWCIVDDFAYVASGSTPSKDSFVEKGVPYIKMYNLRNQKIDFNFHPQYITREVHEGKLQRSKTEVGDLIMNIVGPPLGKLAIIPPSLPESNFNQAAVLIRPYFYKDVLVKYLFYYLSEMSEINSISTKGSAGQVNISLTQSQNMRIALPPLEEQKRIISTVENLFQIVDIIDNGSIDISMAISKVKAQILDLAIHGKLVSQDPSDEPAIELLKRINPSFVPCDNAHYENVPFEIPKSWRWTCMGEVNEYNSASVDPSKSPDNDFELYSVPAYETGMPEFVKGKDISSSKKSVSKNDVLLCKINPHLNRAWIVSHYKENRPCLASSEWIIFRNSSIIPQYLSFCFTSNYFKELMLSNVSGVGGSLMRAQPAIVNKYLFPLPPINEQCRIVAAIQEYYEILDNISANL